MRKIEVFFVLIVLIIFAAGTFSVVNRQDDAVGNKLNGQTKNAGAVTVDVVPIKSGNRFDFEIRFDTHSTELTYKLDEIVKLKGNTGEVLTSVSWEGEKPGGHHRSGKLNFPPFKSKQKSILLIMSNIENKDLEFSWDL